LFLPFFPLFQQSRSRFDNYELAKFVPPPPKATPVHLFHLFSALYYFFRFTKVFRKLGSCAIGHIPSSLFLLCEPGRSTSERELVGFFLPSTFRVALLLDCASFPFFQRFSSASVPLYSLVLLWFSPCSPPFSIAQRFSSGRCSLSTLFSGCKVCEPMDSPGFAVPFFCSIRPVALGPSSTSLRSRVPSLYLPFLFRVRAFLFFAPFPPWKHCCSVVLLKMLVPRSVAPFRFAWISFSTCSLLSTPSLRLLYPYPSLSFF